jgi:2-oxoglutarate ferredoxin oxidoreductase subunit gamma
LKDRYEVILAGTGGQGLVISGKLLAEAAMLEGKNVVQTQSYGIAQRGGLSLSEVIIDKDEIIFQQVQQPDVILALSESAIQKYAVRTAAAPVLYDSSVAKAGEGKFLYGFPFSELAATTRSGAVNMVGLGALVAITGLVSFDSLSQAISQSFSADRAKDNIEAVCSGIQAATQERK